MSYHPPELRFILLLLIASVGSFFLYLKYARLRGTQAALAWLLTAITAVVFCLWRIRLNSVAPDATMSAALCLLLLLPFLTRLHGKWIDGQLTEAECAPGSAGFRAWLSLGNIVIAVLISVTAWYGFGIGLPLMLLLTIGALTVWPLMQTIPSAAAREPASENLSAEREKVLSLLEAGRITAEESTELLNALGATRAPSRSPSATLSAGRKLVLAGSALVLIGFFLPWFTFSPMGELNAAFNQMRQSFPMAEAGFPDGFPKGAILPSGNVTVTGGNIGHGLGWIILLLTLTAGLLPYLMSDLNGKSLHTSRFLALAGGSILLLFLLTQNFRLASIGLVLAVAGCALQWVGLLNEER
ncbi:MAG: hypothetical protein JWL90_1570 [Chthoniobacteraceae bacterium]|nr:hypothetical protein [Chthoniobacteraceae bacterium]